ncbi:Dehydrogenase/reductase SDR family member 12 [Portunus trituberculatus]|uniref:Dehydrogenase/reductase SDR family member 12 n=1 Tax=Portunus trituberculatus TaxID=210409 RepID=A0A5B7IWB2_PORTR|nr:Dehydrogenase/reductase SDR family member 12 [Portunus trituberculatus]
MCSSPSPPPSGSNSGIGLQAALEVARRGGVIHMVCRNREAATKARSEIITTTGNDVSVAMKGEVREEREK